MVTSMISHYLFSKKWKDNIFASAEMEYINSYMLSVVSWLALQCLYLWSHHDRMRSWGNCRRNICTCNICPGDNCTHPEYFLFWKLYRSTGWWKSIIISNLLSPPGCHNPSQHGNIVDKKFALGHRKCQLISVYTTPANSSATFVWLSS